MGYDGSVAVQAPQTLRETEFLLNLAAKNEFILGVVGWVDLCSPTVAGDLERFASNPKFVGVRHIAQGEPSGFLLRKDFQSGISRLAQYDLAYDVLVFPHQLDDAIALVQKFPNQRFVIDHLAKPVIKDGTLEPWATLMTQISKCQNVHCKLSGMVTEADTQKWNAEALNIYTDIALNAFGPARMTIGSDWPVCLSGGSYRKVIGAYEGLIGQLSQEEQGLILGETARSFYQLD